MTLKMQIKAYILSPPCPGPGLALGARVPSSPPSSPDSPALRPDCARCAALCCAAFPFTPSADFPIRKAAGAACPQLRADLRCAVHGELRERGFAGCANFDCFGAGQRVSQAIPGDWRTDPALATRVFDTFQGVFQLHALLWHLEEALRYAPADPGLQTLREELAGHEPTPAALPEERSRINAALLALSARLRGPGPDRRGVDWTGAKRKGADLRGADLFGASLLAADLRGADLRGADLRGVDLRGADLRGADLRGALFLTPSQLASARGDSRTALPEGRERPAHWSP